MTITTSPAKGLEPTLALTERLAEHGYKVVPHLAGATCPGPSALAEIVERMRATGASDVLVMAGDAEVPAGELRRSACRCSSASPSSGSRSTTSESRDIRRATP